MVAWQVVIPVWGEYHLRTFRDVALPSVLAALQSSGVDARLFIVCDGAAKEPTRALVKATGTNVKFEISGVEVAGFKSVHRALGDVHRYALRNAKRGEAVSFINADNVVSRECFTVASVRIAQGARLIQMAGHRTLSTQDPPIGASSRELLDWVWRNRHPWIDDCIWGTGRSQVPAMLHFVSGGDVVTRAFHLHPFCVVNDGRNLEFLGATVDDDLAMSFKPSEIHVVTDPDEMAMGEMSPEGPPRKYPRWDRPFTAADVVEWAKLPAPGVTRYVRGLHRTNERHRDNFTKRIIIQGNGADHGDVRICAEILAAL